MKNQIGLIVLVLVCLGLGIALITVKKQASDQQRKDSGAILTLSNSWTKTSNDLQDQKQVNDNLEKDVETKKQSLVELTNNLNKVMANLSQTETDLKTSREDLTNRDNRIADLEVQNHALDTQAQSLSNSITSLKSQITDTETKLKRSEGDRAFLEKELKRMMAEKQDLERQFNDLAVLRAQVSKLKEEIAVKRRMEWAREGVFANADKKGAERLMQLANPQPVAPKPNYDLNVEVHADGTVSRLTNSPTATPK
jgi:chromosome segregation ATPase